ncbi:MAG TPA: S41 family peptidase [Candidatus Polarisedimenticolia bacterium]|nr:S41 family peptidase [Candidatus Polarisedimenticolia bacterium]
MKVSTDRKVLLALSAGLILFTLSGSLVGRVVAVEGTYSYLKLFNEALYLVAHNYVQPVELETVMEGAYRGMLESLDPANEYLPPAKYEKATRGIDAGPAEVGLALSKRRGYIVVIASAPGSPAAAAGIKTGDALITIDGHSTRQMGVWEAGQTLRGRPGSKTSVSLNAVDGHTGRQSVTLTRKILGAGAPAGSLVPPDVAVVRVGSIREGDAKRLDQVIASLKAKGATRLLLDLRGCVSEALAETIGMASLFMADGTVLTVTDRHEGDKAYRADGRRIAWTQPLAVLVDEGTADTCEALTAALRDSAGAAILGQKTWGLGTVHRLIPLRGGDGVILAVGKMVSPSGKEWNEKGIVPDFQIDGERDETNDPQRQKAIDYLRGLSQASRKAA